MDSGDKLIKEYFLLGLNYQEILIYLELRDNIKISERTLKRRLNALKLYRRKNFTPAENLISFLREQVGQVGKLHGYKWMHLKCLQRGLTVSQEAVRLALNIVDPEGVMVRRRSRLQRRQYFSKGPNFLWHIDGYDKLKPYGIAINGCIDGFSRHILWLKAASTNNDPAVISGYFMEVVEYLGGVPKMIRTDLGTENRYIEQMQTYFSEQNNLANILFIYGKSTSNQRIEAWWSILRKHSAQFWMNLFQSITENGWFTGNLIDKTLIQFVFLRLIQEDLDTVSFEWNTHRISGKKNSVAPKGRPITMFELPETYGTKDYINPVNENDIRNCQQECRYIHLPCDTDIFELCTIIMDDKGLNFTKDPYDSIELYLILRNDILHSL